MTWPSSKKSLLYQQAPNHEATAQRGRLEREMDQSRELISRHDVHRIALEKQAQELDAKIANSLEQQQATAPTVTNTQAKLSRCRTEATAARAQLTADQAALSEAQAKNRVAAEQLGILRAVADEQEKRYATLQQQMEAVRLEHRQLMDEDRTATQNLTETTRSIETVREQESAALTSLNATRGELATLQAQRTAASEDYAKQGSLLAALEEWLLRMQDCHKRLADHSPETLEARHMRNEIEMAMASQRHLLSNRARVAFRPPAAALTHPTQEARAGRITGTFTMPDKPDT